MDINAIKARLNSLNNRTKKANDIWKPKDEHDVRLVPYPFGDDPFVELHFHYDIGGQSVLCPKANFGEECDICDLCDSLKAWKLADGRDKPKSTKEEDWELFKKIQAKARVFIPMIERTKEGEGPRFWGVAPAIATKIIEICANSDRIAEVGTTDEKALEVLFNPKKAYDIHVSFRKPGEKGNGTTFPQIVVEGKIKISKLAEGQKAIDEILAKIKKIDEVYPRLSSAEVSTIFKKFVGGGAKEAKAEGGTEKYSPNTAENAKTVGGKSIDEAFDEMTADAP